MKVPELTAVFAGARNKCYGEKKRNSWICLAKLMILAYQDPHADKLTKLIVEEGSISDLFSRKSD